jgi:serine/threonine-protein kinase
MTDPTPAWKRLLAELKRREVFRAMAYYGAAVFGLLQLADIVFPAIGLPESAVTWLIVVCVAGFPVAMAVAWTFDLTPQGIQRTEHAGTGELEAILAQSRLRRWLAGIAGLAGIALLVAGAWWAGSRTASAEADAPRPAGAARADSASTASVAVLPFVNIGDPEDEPFSDGLAEELANTLAQIEGLRVAARTSAFAFKGRDVDARTIGQELGVGSIVEGSVRRAGGTVRISAQLSRTSDGFRLWADSWERELTAANVFDIQDEITADIALALTRQLSPDARAGIAERRTTNLEAYDLYLIGRHRWASRDADSVRQAIDYYEQAIAIDSSFALAWAGLADAWGVLPFYDRSVPSEVAYPRARDAAERALALAPDLAEANAARGINALEYELDLDTGERLLRRSVELNPSYAQGWAWLCEALAMEARDAEALPACRKATELNPFGVIPNLLLTVALSGAGRTDAALVQAEKSARMFPDVAFSQLLLSDIQLRTGRRAEAAASLEALGRAEGVSDPSALRSIAEAYPGSEPSLRAVAAARSVEREGRSGGYVVTALYDWAGSEADALRVIRAAIETRGPWLGMVATFGAFDGLRDDPELQRILRKAGLPNGSTAYREGREPGGAS